MSPQHTQSDITTLREVQRLLESNQFASIDDLVARAGVEKLNDVTDDLVDSRKVIDLDTTVSTSPLPKRRSA